MAHYEYTITVGKGKGRRGLSDAIDIALIVDGARIRPGVYTVTIEREPGPGRPSSGQPTVTRDGMGSAVAHVAPSKATATTAKEILERCVKPQPLESLDENVAAQLWDAGYLRITYDHRLVVADHRRGDDA